MTRDVFVRVATTALRNRGVPSAGDHAEAIAQMMDMVASIIGDAPPQTATQTSPAPPAAPFPSPNPEAITPVAEPEPPLITLAPESVDLSKVERASAPVAPPPVRSLRPAAATKMKVEDLSRLIQERTPPTLTFDVPMEDGKPQRVMYLRNVVSQHAYDSVQLIYYPPNTTTAAKETCEVIAVISVDDLPVDLSAILKKLTKEAIEAVRPKGAPREVPVRAFAGIVQSQSVYADGLSATSPDAIAGAIGQVLKGSG